MTLAFSAALGIPLVVGAVMLACWCFSKPFAFILLAGFATFAACLVGWVTYACVVFLCMPKAKLKELGERHKLGHHAHHKTPKKKPEASGPISPDRRLENYWMHARYAANRR